MKKKISPVLKTDRVLLALNRHGIYLKTNRPNAQTLYESVMRAQGLKPSEVTHLEGMWIVIEAWLEKAEGMVLPHKARRFKPYVMPTGLRDNYQRAKEARS